jgi:SAM-dependent methyltransferase
MSRSLPDMGDWDAVFDETYLRTYAPFVDQERTRAEALGAASLAELEPGAEVLDCPTGFGRHALVLAEAGYRVTGLDRSPQLLADADRRRGGAEWPHLVRGDYRELPFSDASFDAVFNLFSSLGYLEQDEDVGVLREFRRVLAAGRSPRRRDGASRRLRPLRATLRPANVGAAPRGLAPPRGASPRLGRRDDRRVPRDIRPSGERVERPYVLHVYSAKEWLEMLREAGFGDVDAFGAWDGVTPIGPDVWRLILRAR